MEGALLDFRSLDRLAAGNTALHRLDPRAKVATAIVFTVTVVSFGRYDISSLFPFFLFPALIIVFGDLPFRYIAGKVLLAVPFAVAAGAFNPLFDREVLLRLGPLGISGGWVSWGSIIVRALLTVSAATVLTGVTGFPAICRALEQIGLPRVFVAQLLFLYRYIFVLAEEAAQAARARELRSFGKSGLGLRTYASLVGNLLLRTWLRAERVHRAMLCRGFDGSFPVRQPHRFGAADALFTAGWCSLFILFRLVNIPAYLGTWATGLFS